MAKRGQNHINLILKEPMILKLIYCKHLKIFTREENLLYEMRCSSGKSHYLSSKGSKCHVRNTRSAIQIIHLSCIRLIKSIKLKKKKKKKVKR